MDKSDKSNVCYEDFENICRICLCSKNLESFKELNVYHEFQKIMTIDNESELEEQLPKNICKICIKDLENVSNFLLKCKNTDDILKSIVIKKNENNVAISRKTSDTVINYKASTIYSVSVKTRNCNNIEDEPKITIKEIVFENTLSDKDGKYYKLNPSNTDITKKLFACDYCGINFERIFHLQEHINIHLGLKPFKCNTCGKCFAKRQTLKTHYFVHTGKKPFKCKICEKSFLRRIDFSRHCSKIHNEDIENDTIRRQCSILNAGEVVKNNKELITSKSIDNAGKHTYICKICGKSYELLHQFKAHTKSHIKIKSFTSHIRDIHDRKEGKLAKVIERNRKLTKNGRTFLCNICGKNFTRKGTLEAHIKIHTGEKNFECKICGFKFILKCTLNRHLAVHNDEKKFKCDICGKGLSQKRYLLKHIQIFHGTSKEKSPKKNKNVSHFCSICGRGFITRRWLKHHENLHKSKEELSPEGAKLKETKDFLCTECGKQFTFKCNLDRHLLIIHSGKKPFKCNICGDKFTAKLSLDCHLNIHNGMKPYQCKNCSKSFRQPSSLRKHVLVHTGERQYKCHICEMAFKTSSHLKTHLKRHTQS